MAAKGRPRAAATRRRVRPVAVAAALAAGGLLVAARGALAVRPEPGVAEDGEGEGEGEMELQEGEEAPEEGEEAVVRPQIPPAAPAPACRRWTAAANAGPESALGPVGVDMEQDLAAGVAVNCSGLSLENARITLEGPWGVKSTLHQGEGGRGTRGAFELRFSDWGAGPLKDRGAGEDAAAAVWTSHPDELRRTTQDGGRKQRQSSGKYRLRLEGASTGLARIAGWHLWLCETAAEVEQAMLEEAAPAASRSAADGEL